MKAAVKAPLAPVELRTVLRRRWKVAVLAFLLPLGCALALAFALPSLYQARAVVLVEPPSLGGLGGTADDFSVRIEQLTRENLARPRLEELIREHGLYPGRPGAVAALRNDVEIETQHVEQSSGRISVAITVSVRGRDPDKLAEVANALAQYYVGAEQARQQADSAEAVAELADVRKQLDDEESRIKDFDDTNVNELPEQVQLHVASIGSLSGQLDAVRAARVRITERIHAIDHPAQVATRAPEAPAPEAQPPSAADSELEQAEAQLRDLRSRYTDEHPEVIRMRHHVAVLRARAASDADDEPRVAKTPAAAEPVVEEKRPALEAQLAQLDVQERELQGRIAGAQQAALNAPRRAHERAALLPEVEAARESYTALLKHEQELALARGGGSGRNPFRVFEEAVAPDHPFAPNRPRLAILGVIFSLLVAGGAVWLAEQIDRTFHSASELHAFAGLPVLATIPRIVTGADQRAAHTRAAVMVGGALCAVTAALAVTWLWAAQNEGLVRMLIRRGNS